MRIKFWGTRGTIPVTGIENSKYGGNTPCLEVSVNDESVLIFDAGSGIRLLGQDLLKRNSIKKIYLFLSHFHTDHIHGLPFFAPLYLDDYEINIYGMPYELNSIEEILDLILKPPLFSITKDYFKSKIYFVDIKNGDSFNFEGIKVETIRLNHPNPTLGFKISSDNKSLVYFTDNELINHDHSKGNLEGIIKQYHGNLIEFCSGVDVLIHDSSYSIDDYNKRIGWGHSSNYAVATFAHLADVKKLYLFHYDPDYNDKTVDNFLIETQKFLEEINSQVNCFASRDNLVIEL